jgi:hypothetical protein
MASQSRDDPFCCNCTMNNDHFDYSAVLQLNWFKSKLAPQSFEWSDPFGVESNNTAELGDEYFYLLKYDIW